MTRRGTALIALAAVGATASFTMSVGAQSSGEDDRARARSRALTTAPTPDPGGRAYRGSDAVERAAAIAASIPLPEGGNFEGIRWQEAEGELTEHDIAFVLQYNATCQWHRARRDGREAASAGSVVADTPRWPAFRDTALGAALETAGDRGTEESEALLADCDATHERELAYAAARGRAPSR